MGQHRPAMEPKCLLVVLVKQNRLPEQEGPHLR